MAIINYKDMANYGLYASFYNTAGSTQPTTKMYVPAVGAATPLTSVTWQKIKTNTGEISILNNSITPITQNEAGVIKGSIGVTSGLSIIGTATSSKPIATPGGPQTSFAVEANISGLTQTPADQSISVIESTVAPVTNRTDKAAGATLVTSNKVVGQQTFFFTPGAKQEIGYKKTIGSDINTTVTNGTSTTTSSGGSLTIGTELQGTFAGFVGLQGTVSLGFEQNWGTSKTIDFSTSTSQTQSTSIESASVFDPVQMITPDANGNYFYGKTQLIRGQQYTATISEAQYTVTTPVGGKIVITGNNNTLSGSYANGATGAVVRSNVSTTLNAANELNFAVQSNYGSLVGQSFNAQNWVYSANPDTITTSITAQSKFKGYGASTTTVDPTAPAAGKAQGVSIRPVVTTADVAPAKTMASLSVADSSHISNTISQDTPVTSIDLQTFDTKLNANGIYLDVTNDAALGSVGVTIAGSIGGYDDVNLGNHNYLLTGFNNSIVNFGSGDDSLDAGSSNVIDLGKGANDTIRITGDGNIIKTGAGNTLVILNGTGTTSITNGVGKEVILINDTTAYVAIENWNYKKDLIQFGEKVPISSVKITYDQATQEFHVSVQGTEVATLIADPNNLPTYLSDLATFTGAQPSTIYMGSDNALFLDSLFADAFQRAPDKAAQTFFLNAMQNGASQAQVIVQAMTSAEYNALHQTQASYITAVYADLLGRQPDAAGLSYWSSQLSNGTSEATFVSTIVQSPEFINLVGQANAINNYVPTS